MLDLKNKDIRKEARNNNKAKIVCDDNWFIYQMWLSRHRKMLIYNYRKYINILYKHMKYGIKCVLTETVLIFLCVLKYNKACYS